MSPPLLAPAMLGTVKVIVRDRQAGKTTDLIRLAAAEFLYIVCINHREAYRIAKEAESLGLEIPFPLTWDEFTRREFYPPGIKGVVIDNLDLCVQQMAGGVPVRAVSLTPGD